MLDQHKKLKAHADEYMLKPFDGKDLLVKIGGLLKLNLAAGRRRRRGARARRRFGHRDGRRRRRRHREQRVGRRERRRGSDAGGRPRQLRGRRRGVGAGDTSEQQILPDDNAPATPFEGEKFDPATQAAFAALEAGSPETARAEQRHGRSAEPLDRRRPAAEPRLGEAAGRDAGRAVPQAVPQATDLNPDVYRTGETLGPEPIVSDALLASALADSGTTAEHDVPPAPDEIAFEDVSTEASGRVISESFGAPVVVDEKQYVMLLLAPFVRFLLVASSSGSSSAAGSPPGPTGRQEVGSRPCCWCRRCRCPGSADRRSTRRCGGRLVAHARNRLGD